MGSVLTEGFSLQNCAVIAFVILWFIGWTYAAKNMMRRSEMQKREMVMTAKREIEQQKQRVAKAAAYGCTAGRKSSRLGKKKKEKSFTPGS